MKRCLCQEAGGALCLALVCKHLCDMLAAFKALLTYEAWVIRHPICIRVVHAFALFAGVQEMLLAMLFACSACIMSC